LNLYHEILILESLSSVSRKASKVEGRVKRKNRLQVSKMKRTCSEKALSKQNKKSEQTVSKQACSKEACSNESNEADRPAAWFTIHSTLFLSKGQFCHTIVLFAKEMDSCKKCTCMTDSNESAASPKSTKSSNSDSLVSHGTNSG